MRLREWDYVSLHMIPVPTWEVLPGRQASNLYALAPVLGPTLLRLGTVTVTLLPSGAHATDTSLSISCGSTGLTRTTTLDKHDR